MGRVIDSSQFNSDDLKLFKERLSLETKALKTWFEESKFEKEQAQIGIELEGWLVDKDFLPNPVAESFLSHLNNPQVVPEISTFNFEINSTPYPFKDNCISLLKEEMDQIWNSCKESANTVNSIPTFMGTLATLRPDMLSMDCISSNKRYKLMNDEVMRHRKHKPVRIHLEGKDEFSIEMDSVITECAATSLQIHLGVSQDHAKRYYNASTIASAFVVAVSANSPYFFGKELWDESRIAAFEQSVEIKSYLENKNDFITRVTLGKDYIKHSLFELYEENERDYPVLLPEFNKDAMVDDFHHLNLHNGTIWRWTRPIVGESGDGKKHLRIEQRTPSAGPTIVDSIANSVFFLGLCDFLAQMEQPPEDLLSFKDNRDNFYLAAKQSMYCRVTWLDGNKYDIVKLIKEELLPGIKDCLSKRGIDKKDIDYYIGEIIQGRLDKGINGARWQKAWIHHHGKKFQQLMEVYIENQKSGQPVHTWSI